MNLNREQFLKAVERGQALLKKLKKDYPELSLTPVFSRFGPRSGQCDLTTDLRKIVLEFPEMLAGEFIHREGSQGTQKVGMAVPAVRNTAGNDRHEGAQRTQERTESLTTKSFFGPDVIKTFRGLLTQLKQGAPVEKEVNELERRLLEPQLELYCGDVLIEYRPDNLMYEPLRRLQQDPRLPPGLNTVGNIRVIAGSLEDLNTKEN